MCVCVSLYTPGMVSLSSVLWEPSTGRHKWKLHQVAWLSEWKGEEFARCSRLYWALCVSVCVLSASCVMWIKSMLTYLLYQAHQQLHEEKLRERASPDMLTHAVCLGVCYQTIDAIWCNLPFQKASSAGSFCVSEVTVGSWAGSRELGQRQSSTCLKTHKETTWSLKLMMPSVSFKNWSVEIHTCLCGWGCPGRRHWYELLKH